MSNMMIEDQLFADQIKLEMAMRNEGIDRMNKLLNESRERREESSTEYGHTILAQGLDRFSKGIEEWLNEPRKAGRGHRGKELIKDGDPRVVGFIFMKYIVNGLTLKTASLQSVLRGAVTQIEEDFRLSDLRSQDKKLWRRLIDSADKRTSWHKQKVLDAGMNDEAGKGNIESWEPWSNNDIVQLGGALLTILMNTVGLVETTTEMAGKNKKVKRIRATSDTMEWIAKRCDTVGLTAPMYKPLLVPPRDWTYENLENGVYHTNYNRPVKFIKTRNAPYFQELKHADMDVVLHSVNAMQRTAWQVNSDMYNIVEEMFMNGLDWCPSIPPAHNEPRYRWPENYDALTKDERAACAQERHRIEVSNRENESKRAAMRSMLSTAEEFKDAAQFYLGYNLDFRGRVYSVSSFNGMGMDAMKACIRFAKGKALGESGAKWLAIHLANNGDFDKVSKATLEERVEWVYENEHWIVECAENPWDNRKWSEADKPLQFLAACLEWKGYCEQGEAFVSHLPIALDGSCSGLQHLSMAMRCTTTAVQVNILPTDTPKDIYQTVADKVVAQLVEDSQQPFEHWGDPVLNNQQKRVPNYTELALEWLKFGFGRSEAKRSVMTYSYGSKQYGFREQIIEDVMRPLKRKCKKTGAEFPFSYDDGYRAASYIARLLWDAVVGTVKRPAILMDWLTEAASKVAKTKFTMQDGSEQTMPVRWTTPLGLPVLQSYYNMESRRVKTNINGALVYLSMSKETDQICSRKSAQGMSPNVVHSWDAAHLQLTVSRAADEGIDSFSLIHDSFATHAALTDEFWHTIRESMVEMYQSSDIVHDLYLELRKQLKPEDWEDFNLPPSKGTLELANTVNSRYSFA